MLKILYNFVKLKTNNMRRRNLSLIYFFEKFDDEERREPTCFEDCTEQNQNRILKELNREMLENLTKQLAKALRDVGDGLDLCRE